MRVIRQLGPMAGAILALILVGIVVAGPPDRRELEPAVVAAVPRLLALVASPAAKPEEIINTYFWAQNNHRPDVGEACRVAGGRGADADYSDIEQISVVSIGGREPTIKVADFRSQWSEVAVLWVEYRVRYAAMAAEDDGPHGKNCILVRQSGDEPWRILGIGY